MRNSKPIFLFAILLILSTYSLDADAVKPKSKATPTPTPQPAAPEPEVPTREQLLIQGQKRASYREIFAEYKAGFDLNAYFSGDALKLAPDLNLLKSEWESRGSQRISKLQSALERQEGMQRGEIEESAVSQGAKQLLQLSLLRLRAMGAEQSVLWLQSEGTLWLRVLQNIAFEESTHLALIWSAEMRSMMWREMLRKIKEHPDRIQPAAWATELQSVQLPWPVDRMLLSEARKSLPTNAMIIANKLAIELQKNPHKSVAELRKSVRGGNIQRLNVLDAQWSAEDVKRMENEMDQLAEIRLQLGIRRFIAQKSQSPKDLNEVLTFGLVDAIPTCYRTGKAWELMQLSGVESP